MKIKEKLIMQNSHVDRWWKDREDLKRGALEYLKLMHFYVKDQFEL
jgi:hypothetical protein